MAGQFRQPRLVAIASANRVTIRSRISTGRLAGERRGQNLIRRKSGRREAEEPVRQLKCLARAGRGANDRRAGMRHILRFMRPASSPLLSAAACEAAPNRPS